MTEEPHGSELTSRRRVATSPLNTGTPRPPGRDRGRYARYRRDGLWRAERFDGLLRDWARRDPTTTAVIDTRRSWTYAQLDAAADHVARGLADLGVQRGDRVVLQLPNRGEYLEAWFGLQRLGAVPVHAMPGHRRAEISHLVAQSAAAAVIVADRHGRFDLQAMATAIAEEQPSPRPFVVVVGTPSVAGAVSFSDLTPPASSGMGEDGDRHAYSNRSVPDDVALLLLSGGTTGRPKLIPRTHSDYALNVRLGVRAARLSRDSVYLAALPIGFNFTFACPGVLGTLSVGGTVVLSSDPSPTTAFPLIAEYQVSHTSLTPALVPAWLDEAVTASASASSLASLDVVQVGGARLAPEVAARIEPALGARLQQVYGMAEGLVCYTGLDDPEGLVLATQGRPACDADEIRIVDVDDGEPVPAGKPGELLTRGPCTISAYYGAGAERDRAFDPDGFYRTGDVVRQYPTGHLTVVGRVKDQINRGGEKYAAAEVEEHLAAHPAIGAVAVVGIEEPDGAEVAVAVVVANGEVPTIAKLRAHLKDRGLAAYKAPQRVHPVAELPLTPIGKADKAALRTLLAETDSLSAPTRGLVYDRR
ncbi:MAG: (2,3-dihydroxybenzoyl)adenylate synthase [Acidimicrobiales bacterium]